MCDRAHEIMVLELRKEVCAASMKVECKISAEYKEPYAVLYINRMTEAVAEIISVLEKENANSRT